MFASWSAGEYGNIGATEWLEVSTELLPGGEIDDYKMCIFLFCLFSELHVLS